MMRRDASEIADNWRVKRDVAKVEAGSVRIMLLQNELMLYNLEQQIKDLRKNIEYIG